MSKRNSLGLLSLIGITALSGCCVEPKQPERSKEDKILDYLQYGTPINPVHESSQSDFLYDNNGNHTDSRYRSIASPDLLSRDLANER